MKNLEEIKNEVAKENGHSSWKSIYGFNITSGQMRDNLWPDVARRFSIEVSRAALENAAKNGKIITAGFYDGILIDSKSITDERNIPKI